MISALFAAISSVHAGGTSWNFQVTSFTAMNKMTATVVLVPQAVDQSPAPGCSTVTLNVRFNPEPVGMGTWNKFVTSESHLASLKRLRGAAKTRSHIRLGEIGQGLLRSRDDACTLLSRGLTELDEDTGARAVFSFNRPI